MSKQLAILYYCPIDRKVGATANLDERIGKAVRSVTKTYPDAVLTWALINPGDWPYGLQSPYNVGPIRCETGIVQPGHILIGTIDQRHRG